MGVLEVAMSATASSADVEDFVDVLEPQNGSENASVGVLEVAMSATVSSADVEDCVDVLEPQNGSENASVGVLEVAMSATVSSADVEDFVDVLEPQNGSENASVGVLEVAMSATASSADVEDCVDVLEPQNGSENASVGVLEVAMSATVSSADVEDYVDVLENELNVTCDLNELKVTSNDCYGVNELKVTSNDCYGVIPRNEIPANEDASVLIKSAKFTKMEKCLLVVTAIESVMLVIAIICVAVTYPKCRNVEKQLKFSSKSNALEIENLSLLESSFSVLELETRTKLLEVMRDMNTLITNVGQYINHLNNSHEILASKVSLLREELYQYQDGLNRTILNTMNATNSQLEQVRKKLNNNIINATIIAETQINNFTMKIIADIMVLHSFNSCADLGNLSLLFHSGIYRVRSYNCSFIHKYCSINTAFSCSGVSGNWRRIAYLNTNENLMLCPPNFEVRDPISNPPLCRRINDNKGCNSVTYPSNGMSYSQVCGTVRVHPEGALDGFDTFRNRSMYVDGVYLTYGHSSNRNNIIWTYTAAVTVGSSTRGCDQCNHRKPSNIPGTNFTCTSAHCSDGNSCFSNTLWGNEAQQCFGNETFYRQLSESTTDNIEMTVCRDQGRDDEDILISFVEIFVL